MKPLAALLFGTFVVVAAVCSGGQATGVVIVTSSDAVELQTMDCIPRANAEVATILIRGRSVSACRISLRCQVGVVLHNAEARCLSSDSAACPSWRTCFEAEYDDAVGASLATANETEFAPVLVVESEPVHTDVSPYPSPFGQRDSAFR